MKYAGLTSAEAKLQELPNTLAPFPSNAEGPVFKAPWEAKAFALTVSLHERGAFTWKEWAAALASTIRAAQAAGDPDCGDTYYRHWLAALEQLVIGKGLFSDAALAHRGLEWQEAARRTPHGQPIELRR